MNNRDEKRDDMTWRIVVAVVLILIMLVFLLLSWTRKPDEPEQPVVEQSAVQLLRRQRETLTEWQELIMAIAFTESRFRPDAVGGAGDTGVLQITTPYVNEINRLYGTSYTIEDAFDVDKSLEMFELLQGCYNPNRNIDSAIYFHNKSAAYRKAVLENLEMIKRYEELRSRLTAR